MATTARDLEFDEDGFLCHPEHWNEILASELAERGGITPLTDAHWAIIESLREHYFRTGGIPAFEHICHIHHMDKYCVDKLFRNSPLEAWRIAGLPNPGEEAKAYM